MKSGGARCHGGKEIEGILQFCTNPLRLGELRCSMEISTGDDEFKGRSCRVIVIVARATLVGGDNRASVRLGSEMPYARAAKQFEELTHVTLSKNRQRMAKEYGGRLVAQQAPATVQLPSRRPCPAGCLSTNIRLERGEVTVSAVRHLDEQRPFDPSKLNSGSRRAVLTAGGPVTAGTLVLKSFSAVLIAQHRFVRTSPPRNSC